MHYDSFSIYSANIYCWTNGQLKDLIQTDSTWLNELLVTMPQQFSTREVKMFNMTSKYKEPKQEFTKELYRLPNKKEKVFDLTSD